MTGEKGDFPLLIRRIVNRVGRPFGVNPFPRSFENPLAEGKREAAEVFETVYAQNFWGSEQSRSGVGSEAAFAARYRDGLRNLLEEQNFKRVFDAPCGDLNWMSALIAETHIDYLGGDVSPSVVQDVRRRHPALDVRVFDITRDPFPEAQVWHCRDCLFHLPFDAIRAALTNFVDSSIPYALLTTHRARVLHRNLDVNFGGFRFLDLERDPIALPKPLARIPDFTRGTDFPRYVCLWTREQVAEALGSVDLDKAVEPLVDR